jgi:hypothetical protein
LTNKPIEKKPSLVVETASSEERRKFFELFCNRNKQYSNRAENIRNASARYALETITDPDQRHELALLAIDTNETLEKLTNDLVDGRVSRLTKADYEKYVGPYERASADAEVAAEKPAQAVDSLLSSDEEKFMQSVVHVLELANAPREEVMDGYIEQMRLSVPANAPSRSKRISRLGAWVARRGGRRA